MKRNFGMLVKRVRKEKGLSLSALADKTKKHSDGISSSYINRIENGDRTDPNVKYMRVLMEALNLDLYETLDAFDMGNIYKDALVKEKTIYFPEGLKDFEVYIEHLNKQFKLNEKEKVMFEDIISMMFMLDEQNEDKSILSQFMSMIWELERSLSNKCIIVLEEEPYSIKINVQQLVKEYGHELEKIKQELMSRHNIKALAESDEQTIFLQYYSDMWIAVKKNDQYVVENKMQDQLKYLKK